MRILLLKIFYPLLALSAFINPMYGLLAYAFITIIRPECFSWGSTSIQNIFFMTLSCLLLSIIINRQLNVRVLKNSFFISFILFYIFLYISTYTSPYTYISLKQKMWSFQFLNTLPTIYLYCIALFILLRDEVRINKFVTFITGCFLFMALWGIEQRTHGNMLIEGLFGNAIKDRCAITGVFVLYFPLTIYCFDISKWKELGRKFIGIFGMIAFPVLVFFTDSRAGFLGFMLTLGILGLSAKRKFRIICILLLAVTIGFPLLPETYRDRIGSIVHTEEDQGERDSSSGSRLLLWAVGIKIFVDNPMFGVGCLNFPEVAYEQSNYFTGKVDDDVFQYTFQENFKLLCHNMYINILAEGGLLSTVPFYLLILLPLIKSWRLQPPDINESPLIFEMYKLIKYLRAGLFGYLLTCAFANMRFIDFMYWNLALLYIVCEFIDRRRRIDAVSVIAAGQRSLPPYPN